eukprot:TRINITY_DN9720_c0_g1_i1.p1 TRINITY_DN9720_c0_g1~~TRINITY_DN9720_c0_g1_i1.p1  ORF type:complete len:258 (+),score=58.71 TRINITY_DN9720_c0_g1_i1:148-921(+)
MKIWILTAFLVQACSLYPLLSLEPLPERVPYISSLAESYEAPERCVSLVTDQGRCSPWPIVAAQVLADRYCRRGISNSLSAQDMVNCHLHTCISLNDTAGLWNYLTNYGIVTERCMPYTAWTGFASMCSMGCEGGEIWRKFKCREGSVINTSNTSVIKEQISRYGSVMAEMNVYLDFIYHKKGIYEHKKPQNNVTDYLGRHAVRCFGYGREEGVDYWKCANSWSYNWGDNGIFKIKMGEAGIDSSVWTCIPGRIVTA